jgi:hypothetical protein
LLFCLHLLVVDDNLVVLLVPQANGTDVPVEWELRILLLCHLKLNSEERCCIILYSLKLMRLPIHCQLKSRLVIEITMDHPWVLHNVTLFTKSRARPENYYNNDYFLLRGRCSVSCVSSG